jgi:heterodisulfide reductase subunit D
VVKRQSHKKDLGIVTAFHLTDCTHCGNECADVCPVYRFYNKYNPQDLARLYLREGPGGIGGHRLLWGCVTCRACTEACPYDVEFADFIRELRISRTDYQPVYDGLVHRYQRLQAAPHPSAKKRSGLGTGKGARKTAVNGQDRLSWIDDSLDVNRTRGIVLFVGCTPFFEIAFGETCGIQPIESARSAVRILNGLGISPVILENENCCGRDLYDIGDRETFAVLARHNIALLKSRTIKTVLTLCPECAYTLRVTYRQLVGKMPFDVMHITEYIAGHVDQLDFEKSEKRIAFHDPCYLARYLGCTEAPRAILSAVAGGNLVEMERHGLQAPCCGAGSWVNHGPHTRFAVNERIVEARRSGAEAIVTACPKCMIVFNEVDPGCAWKQAQMEIMDLVTLTAKRLHVAKKRK